MAKFPRLKRLDMYTLREARDRFVEAQNGVCAICRRTFTEELFPNLDHCHETGFYRGALCTRCNGALGWYERHHRSAQDYLSRARLHQAKANPARTVTVDHPKLPTFEDVGPMQSLQQAAKQVIKDFTEAKARRSRQMAADSIATSSAA